jgi:DNA-binding transcriptional MerR regulator
MRIGELARRSGVSRETIHFYLREGLLPRSRKAGRNMAFYDEAHLERLLLIKRLQNERFLPLFQIKRLLSGGAGQALADLDLIGHLSALAGGEPVPGELGEREIRRRTGLSAEKLARAAALGLVTPVRRGGQTAYSAEDARVLDLLGEAVREVGYDFELAAQSFALYLEHMKKLVRDEAQLVLGRLMTAPSPIALVETLRRARELQLRILGVARARWLKPELEHYLAQVEHSVAVSGGPSAFPLSETLLAALGHPARVRRLQETARESPRAACALVALEYQVGHIEELTELAQKMRQRHGELGELVLYQGAALVDIGEFEAGIALLRRAVELLPESALVRATLGSAQVRRARRTLLEAGAVTAMREAAAGLAELERSRGAAAATLGEGLFTRFLRGRVWTAVPRFFGTFAQGIAELETLLAESSAGGPALKELAGTGVLPRLRGNGLYFLGVTLEAEGRTAEARQALLSAAEIDPQGLLATRARERLQGVRR